MKERPDLKPSLLKDTYVRDRLPPPRLMPDCRFASDLFDIPQKLNAADLILRSGISAAGKTATALIEGEHSWTYGQLDAMSNRIAGLLVRDTGLVPGNRVLLHGPNGLMTAAAWFGIVKAGGIAVTTPPLASPGEIADILMRARVSTVLCHASLGDAVTGLGQRTILFDSADAELDRIVQVMPDHFGAFTASSDDAALIAFTSGTTGSPKATVHFHRDLLAICQAMPRHLISPGPGDVFSGTPPFAFTFGLGGLLLFPLYHGAAAAYAPSTRPEDLLATIARHRVSVLFTAATGYRSLLDVLDGHDVGSLRVAIASGEHLPETVSDEWLERTGLRITEVLGSTEMLHAYVGCGGRDIRPGRIGRVIPGYEARIVDDTFRDVADGETGRLLVRGPTGCRYLDDPRQRHFVHEGWTVTSDHMIRDEDGYLTFAGRADDMIVSAGYNISPMEVEDALLRHPAVRECVVVAAPDERRGNIVAAIVATREPVSDEPGLVDELQAFVKNAIAPYKYPRRIIFSDTLPRTATGKIRRGDLLQHLA